jgi:hypothetical protein
MQNMARIILIALMLLGLAMTWRKDGQLARYDARLQTLATALVFVLLWLGRFFR